MAYAASFIQWFSEQAKRANGEIIPSAKEGARILATREPIGVVAAITPWNFPLAMLTRKLGPALAAGCTGLIKPANNTPLSAFALLALAEQAGVPAGVLNGVVGILMLSATRLWPVQTCVKSLLPAQPMSVRR